MNDAREVAPMINWAEGGNGRCLAMGGRLVPKRFAPGQRTERAAS